MSAKKQITKEQIIETATAILREKGMDAINARSLAKKLGCSTRPIYLSFGGMEELKNAVAMRAKKLYAACLRREIESGRYPVYKAYGMGYIRFAREEKKLFGYLFMRERPPESRPEEDGSEEEIYRVIMKGTGLSYEKAKLFHMELWVFVHGIAAMLATAYLDPTEAEIAALVSDAYRAFSLKFGCTDMEKRTVKEKENERNSK